MGEGDLGTWDLTQLGQMYVSDCVYMLEHNRVMNVSNEDWIHVNGFIQSASPKGSSHDRISDIDRIAGLEPVIVCYLPTCVLNRIGLPGVHVLRMLENVGRGFHPEMEGDKIITPSQTPRTPLLFVCRQIVFCFYVAVNRTWL